MNKFPGNPERILQCNRSKAANSCKWLQSSPTFFFSIFSQI